MDWWVKIKDNEYVFIGSEFFSFQSLSEIHTFVSPVGNNDVPYPYAIDSNNNYYLLAENVVLTKMLKPDDNPYDYYYQYGIAIKDMRVSNVHHETAIPHLFHLQEIESNTCEKIIMSRPIKLF